MGKIYVRSISGVFTRRRIALVIFTQLLFYGLPWVNWNHRQAILFDFVGRKFYLFGIILWPHKLIWFVIFVGILVLGVFLSSAIVGRIFCGYACPEVVYTEIFTWIERKIEGGWLARIRLDSEVWLWNFRKWRIKFTKQFLWICISIWTGFVFVGYLSPIRHLGLSVIRLELGSWLVFWLCFYSLLTWVNAGFLRERFCKYVCLYLRFQRVIINRNTILVAYDRHRGEPRRGRSKKIDHVKLGLGDCVDCDICIQTCPMGIDIRNGFQHMCIDCGACIDACNQVMGKMGYPPGLIRYATEKETH